MKSSTSRLDKLTDHAVSKEAAENKKEEIFDVNKAAADTLEDLDKEIKKSEDKENKASENKIDKSKLIKDLDLEEFYFTNRISYQFNLSKVRVTLKVLTSLELMETQSLLWKSTKDDISSMEVGTKYGIELLSRAIVKYNKTDLSEWDLEKKKTFVGALPSTMLNILMEKYSILELSAKELIENEEELSKN